MQDRIDKTIELNAPVSRVWRALIDHEEFGQWFRAKLEGPFKVGEVSRGRVTYPGYENYRWEAEVTAMEPERLFAFNWCPYSHDPGLDYATQPHTLVEFRLEAVPGGTRVHISESGFSALPDDARRIDALRMNTEGWDIQAGHIEAHVGG